MSRCDAFVSLRQGSVVFVFHSHSHWTADAAFVGIREPQMEASMKKMFATTCGHPGSAVNVTAKKVLLTAALRGHLFFLAVAVLAAAPHLRGQCSISANATLDETAGNVTLQLTNSGTCGTGQLRLAFASGSRRRAKTSWSESSAQSAQSQMNQSRPINSLILAMTTNRRDSSDSTLR